jgi:hypothetical protein
MSSTFVRYRRIGILMCLAISGCQTPNTEAEHRPPAKAQPCRIESPATKEETSRAPLAQPAPRQIPTPVVTAPGERLDGEGKAFQNALLSASSPLAARDVILKAIDDGLIGCGTTLKEMRVLLGPVPSYQFAPPDGRVGIGLSLLRGDSWPFSERLKTPPDPNRDPHRAVPQKSDEGWRFSLAFYPGGSLEGVAISDLGKSKRPGGREPAEKIRAFHGAFLAAETARAKRDLVLKAMSDGLLSWDTSQATVGELFGDALILQPPNDEGEREGHVSFESKRSGPDDMRQGTATAPLRGWYMEFTFRDCPECVVGSYAVDYACQE